MTVLRKSALRFVLESFVERFLDEGCIDAFEGPALVALALSGRRAIPLARGLGGYRDNSDMGSAGKLLARAHAAANTGFVSPIKYECVSLDASGGCRIRVPRSCSAPACVHYLRIPRTGSSTTAELLRATMRDNVTACGAIMVHEHETTARMVAKQSAAKTPKVFTVIREPCQRFASAFEYIRSFGMRTDSFMNSKMAKLQNKTSKLQVGWSGSALIRMKKGDPIHGMASAADWARLLLTNATYRQVEWADLMPSLDYKHAHAFLKDVLMISKQIWWFSDPSWLHAGPSVEIVCLSHLRDELSATISRLAPGCNLHRTSPDLGTSSRRDLYSPRELCPLVRRLYPEDYALWKRRCMHS